MFQTWSFSKLEDCSLLVFSLLKRLIKFPHAKDHERFFPHVLLLLGENLTIKTPLHERYSSFGSKANEYCCFPYRLLFCVMVRLGPEDTTRLIPMRPEVLEHSTSRHTVIIFKSERFKGRSNFFIWLLADGTFETNLDSYQTCLSLCLYLYIALLLISLKGLHITCSMLLLSM